MKYVVYYHLHICGTVSIGSEEVEVASPQQAIAKAKARHPSAKIGIAQVVEHNQYGEVKLGLSDCPCYEN